MQLGLYCNGTQYTPPHPNSQGLPIKNTHIDVYWYLENTFKVLRICWLYFYPGYLQIITMEFLKFPIPPIFAPFLRSRKNRWQHIYIRVWFWNSSKKIYPNINKRNKRDRLKKRIFYWEEFDIMKKFYCLNCLWKDSFEKYLNCNHIKEQLLKEMW